MRIWLVWACGSGEVWFGGTYAGMWVDVVQFFGGSSQEEKAFLRNFCFLFLGTVMRNPHLCLKAKILSFALKMSLRRTWCARIFGCGFFLLLLNKGRIKGA